MDFAGYRKKIDSVRSSRFSFAHDIANSVWVDRQLSLNETYKEVMQRMFHAEVEGVDFGEGGARATADAINSWCDRSTKGRIKDIASLDALPSDPASLMLVNAVYFESPWVH